MTDIIAGRAELLDPLAQGATGALWRAIDLRYDQVCAGKVMRQRDGAEMLRFVREQSVGARGEHAIGPHTHLVLPYTWAAEDDAVVLLMPLVHGGTLEQALADHGALHPQLVLEVTRQLLDGLAAVHAAGWVHRDVKPANLLLEVTGTDAPHVRLSDFGIALHHDDARLTATGMVPGTPGYVAPEVLRGQLASAAQDLWAVGVIALRAIDPLAKPTTPENAEAALGHAMAGTGGSLPGSRELADVIRCLLAAEPDQRGTAAEVRDRIQRPSAPASDWVRTAFGEPFEVFDQIDPPHPGSPGAGKAEVPSDGPGSQSAVSRGLHDRLAQRARPKTPVAPPARTPVAARTTPPAQGAPAAQAPAAAAAPARRAEMPARPMASPAPRPASPASRQASQVPRPASPAPSHAAPPAAARTTPPADSSAKARPVPPTARETRADTQPASRRTRRLWPAVLLIVIAALALLATVAFGIFAARADDSAAGKPSPDATAAFTTHAPGRHL